MVNIEKEKHQGREMKYSHILHALLPISFMIIWVLDSQILNLTTFFNDYVPFLVRITLFVVILILAFLIMYLSHKTLFSEGEPSESLITGGILKYTRNPLYFGVLLIYIALLSLSLSLISIGYFIIVVILYNKMVNFEENKLEEIFQDEYLKYKEEVPKWIPKLF